MTLSFGGETLLHFLAALRIEHRRLESVVVDVDRQVRLQRSGQSSFTSETHLPLAEARLGRRKVASRCGRLGAEPRALMCSVLDVLVFEVLGSEGTVGRLAGRY